MVPPGLAEVAPPLLVICGATGSGKAVLARALASMLRGEIVYADSRKIYRGLNIGTAKPSIQDRAGIPHHLLDVCSPGEVFNAHRYAALATPAIDGIRERGRVPIVVAGTGLYLKALLRGLIDTPPRDDRIREALLQEERAQPGSLHRRLAEVDPSAAARILSLDLVRTVRALEVWAITGKTLSAIQRAHGFRHARYRALQLAPDWPRQELYRRIDERVERMIAAGWIDEVKRLRQDLPGDGRGLGVLGYRQLSEHLDGRFSLEESVVRIQREHRRYARRQLAWFRADPQVCWRKAPVEAEEVAGEAKVFLASGSSSRPWP